MIRRGVGRGRLDELAGEWQVEISNRPEVGASVETAILLTSEQYLLYLCIFVSTYKLQIRAQHAVRMPPDPLRRPISQRRNHPSIRRTLAL